MSSHGYGHATRTAGFLEHLLARVACALDVTASCPQSLWSTSLMPSTTAWREMLCDPTVVQAGDLAIDPQATAKRLESWAAGYEQRVEAEAARLRRGFRAVLADVPPLAFDAAHLAGIPAFALANFSWDWVYRQLHLTDAAAAAARAYAHADTLFELDPHAPMPAFRRRIHLGTIGRRASGDRHRLRRSLGVEPWQRLVLIAFRDPTLCRLPPLVDDIRYIRDDIVDTRRDVIAQPLHTRFVDLVAAADAVVAKAGYGTLADTAANGTPLLYVVRQGFPEDPILDQWLARSGRALRIERASLEAGAWMPDLEELLVRERPQPIAPADLTPAIERLVGVLSS